MRVACLSALLSLGLLLLLGPAVSHGQEPADDAVSPPSAEPAVDAAPRLTADDLEAWLDGFMPWALATGDLAGAVVVVVKDGQPLLQKGYGKADLESGAAVDPHGTLFRPGSVSKLFTWTAVMQLVEQGRLDLDADVNQYLDFALPERDGKPVTLRQILTHTTGMEEQIRGLIASDPDTLVPLGEALKHWVPERIHPPGTTPAYSNYATALAGYIVERVSGEPFYDYIDAHILAPLGMLHSSFRQPLPEALLAKMSKGYGRASEGKPMPYELINLAPAGSLAASGADMGRFMLAHLNGGAFGEARILKPETVELMHRTGQPSVGPLNRMMLGFYETTINGHRAIAHGGDTQWFHSDLQLFPDAGVGLFVSMNSSGREGATGQVRSNLVQAFAERYLPGPAPGGPGIDEAAAAAQAQAMAGAYRSSRRADSNPLSMLNLLGPITVQVNADGSLSVPLAMGPGGAPKTWKAIGPWLWQDTASGSRMAAEVENGEVLRFSMEPYAPIMVFERLHGLHAVAMPLMAVSLAALLLHLLAWPLAALVRRRYRQPYPYQGRDARAHGLGRIGALAVLLAFGGGLGLIVYMISDLENLAPSMDGALNAARLFATLALPLGTLALLWSSVQVWRSAQRGWLSRLWMTLLAVAAAFLLWLGFAYHLIGYGAGY